MSLLEVRELGHVFPGGHRAIAELSFTVDAGELVCVVGPSGCGKSTLLRAVGGLLPPSSGEVRLHGDPVRGVPVDLAVVFQDYSRSLFPWLSTRRNVEFPLRWRGLDRAERRERATEALSAVGLADAGERFPWQLSGGMQQRAAIARALACRPAVLLMDEPFASVDAQTRLELEDLLRQVQREPRGMEAGGACGAGGAGKHCTVLLVTHDIDESVYLADRVLVLSPSPATIVADLAVGLPADRDQITTRESPEFVALRGEIARLLRGPAGVRSPR
ncbi:ABC transporter ATP-binding protein [Pseudonocardia sp. DSM 110487]|uniref:ABC transporter ATP-binding protein n=1 Tax=Pseudonocardia sp. DSM 110487 TaxID=2865833 RepID=UPI001C6A2ACF|nr:ABC transporter ATP-binding protein [Pseudonocardia sp. DSM 110487]QYN35786.1 ABC transporter ATP-binding protein [Pseudonocardia sp. DSM 110487]